MEVKAVVSLNGLEEALTSLGSKLAKKSLRKALKQSMKLIEDEAKSRAPVDTGALRDSIATKVKISPKYESGSATVSPMYDRSLVKGNSASASSQQPGVYAKWVEFGIPSKPNYPRKPFLRPAFDAKADQVVEKFAQILREGLFEVIKEK